MLQLLYRILHRRKRHLLLVSPNRSKTRTLLTDLYTNTGQSVCDLICTPKGYVVFFLTYYFNRSISMEGKSSINALLAMEVRFRVDLYLRNTH